MSNALGTLPDSRAGDGGSQRGSLRTVLIVVGVVLAVCLLVFWFIWNVAMPNSVKSQGNRLERQITADYNTAQTSLASCVNQTRLSASVATANTAAVNKVITDAVGGQKYDLHSAAGQNALLLAIKQAYPDTSGVSKLYNAVLSTINGCQIDFQHQQTAVQASVQSFTSWLSGSWKTRHFGSSLPNHNLVWQVAGAQPLYGDEALRKMGQPIVNTETANAFQNGTYNPTDPFATPSATPTH